MPAEPKTRVFRLDASGPSTLSLDEMIIAGCDKQLAEGFRLATMIVIGDDLVLTFQKVDNFDPPKPITT